MKLLREFFISPNETEHLMEKNEKTGEVNNIFIRGIFAQSELQNKNGRSYPDHILEREAYRLQTMIAENKLTGDLDHPEKPEVLLKNAAIIITKLKKDGNNYIGEAKILKETRHGMTAWGLAKGGYKFGTSTRGLGSLTEKNGVNIVNEDYRWLTNDLVADPSAPDAWCESILENKEFFIDNGMIREDVAMSYYNRLHRLPSAQLEQGIVNMFNDWLNEDDFKK